MAAFSKIVHKFKECSHFKQNVVGFKKCSLFKKCSYLPFLGFLFYLEFSINVFTNLKRNHVFENLFANSKYVRGIWKNVLISKFSFINLKMFCNFKKSTSLFNFVHILKKCSCFLNFLKNFVLNKLFIISKKNLI